MKSEYDKNSILSRQKNVSHEEIVNMDKFKQLDDRYLITGVCSKMGLQYEISDDDNYNIYYNSFSLSISFNKVNKINTIGCFVDPKEFTNDCMNKLVMFVKNVIINNENDSNKNSIDKFKSILNKILSSNIKEIRDNTSDFKLFVSKMLNSSNDLVFIMMNKNDA